MPDIIDSSFIILGTLKSPAIHGLEELQRALAAVGSRPGTFNVGTFSGSSEIRRLVEGGSVGLDLVPDAFAFIPQGLNGYLLVGYDDRGLMYCCLEIAERLRQSQRVSTEAISRSPHIAVRGVYTFLHSEALEREWFYSEEYWRSYFGMLARSKFNMFNLVFGHQTGYLSPLFPYFIEVPEHPEVVADDVTEREVTDNLRMLGRITSLAVDHGIDFVLGVWEVRPWTGGEADWRAPQVSRIRGLSDANITEYTYRALRRLLDACPDIRGVQVRVNEESGIPLARQTEFFSGSVFRAIGESTRPVFLDLRGWGARPETVDSAVSACRDLRLSVKYWAEFMGAPYQPAKTMPGYSYADFLRKPMRYRMMWQVWSLGSHRVLLWGDLAYVRRFVESLSLGDGLGFEINQPLAQKGYGNEPEYWRIFKNRSDEYFRWEIDRYWYFFSLFGNLSFDPTCSESFFERQIAERLGGKVAERVLDLYSAGSKVVPFIVQFALSDPNMYIWPEIDEGGLLDFFLATPTTDPCVIETIGGYVRFRVGREPSGKLPPGEASEYLDRIADRTLALVTALRREGGSKELSATVGDFEIAAYLAKYFALMIRAALELERYYASRDGAHLRDCRDLMRDATGVWEVLSGVAQERYHEHMVTGPTDAGHWKTKLQLVYEDELRVEELVRTFDRYGDFDPGFDFGAPAEKPPREHLASGLWAEYSAEPGFTEVDGSAAYDPSRGYGFVGASGIRTVCAPNVRLAPARLDNRTREATFRLNRDRFRAYRNMVYADYVWSDGPASFRIDLPDGDYEVIVILCDRGRSPDRHGPMDVRIGEVGFTDIVVAPFEHRELSTRCTVREGHIVIEFRAPTGGDWFVSGICVRSLIPKISHLPRYVIAPHGDETISATVTSPDPIRAVSLAVSSSTGQSVIPMHSRDGRIYRASARDFAGIEGAFRYSIRATGEDGRESRSSEVSSIIAPAEKGSIVFRHDYVATGRAGMDLSVETGIRSTHPLSHARLYYSHVNQYHDMQVAELNDIGGRFRAVIPAAYVDARWDLLYYFEAVDIYGNGAIFPSMWTDRPYAVVRVI